MSVLPSSSTPAGARFVRDSGYDGCVELTNALTRVVLEPNTGGRVLSYRRNGAEVLWQDPAQHGLVWDGRTRIRHLGGGRFDVGPEYGGPPHEELWLGRWSAEITGPRAARLASAVAPSGLQLVREFALAAASTHLRCTQIMRNRGTAPLAVFHWGRTLAIGNGIALAPLPVLGRFPRGYSLGGPPGVIDFVPPLEPGVRIRDGVLEIIGSPAKAKFNFDVGEGWLAYLAPNGLLFLKVFPIDPARAHGELAANNASIWYRTFANTPDWPGGEVVEIEPIGPREIIAPGAECAFAEDWWLEPFAFPPDRTVDLARVRGIVAAAPSPSPYRASKKCSADAGDAPAVVT